MVDINRGEQAVTELEQATEDFKKVVTSENASVDVRGKGPTPTLKERIKQAIVIPATQSQQYAQAAKQSETNAKKSAIEAEKDADRAKSEADRAKQISGFDPSDYLSSTGGYISGDIDIKGQAEAYRFRSAESGSWGFTIGTNAIFPWIAPTNSDGDTDYSKQLRYQPSTGRWQANNQDIYTEEFPPTANDVGALPDVLPLIESPSDIGFDRLWYGTLSNAYSEFEGQRAMLRVPSDNGGFDLAFRTVGYEYHIRIYNSNDGAAGDWDRLYSEKYPPNADAVNAVPMDSSLDNRVAKLHAGTNKNASIEFTEANEEHGIIFGYKGDTSWPNGNYGFVSVRDNNRDIEVVKYPRDSSFVDYQVDLKEKGERVYSPNNKPPLNDIGAEPTLKPEQKRNIYMKSGAPDEAIGFNGDLYIET